MPLQSEVRYSNLSVWKVQSTLRNDCCARKQHKPHKQHTHTHKSAQSRWWSPKTGTGPEPNQARTQTRPHHAIEIWMHCKHRSSEEPRKIKWILDWRIPHSLIDTVVYTNENEDESFWIYNDLYLSRVCKLPLKHGRLSDKPLPQSPRTPGRVYCTPIKCFYNFRHIYNTCVHAHT